MSTFCTICISYIILVPMKTINTFLLILLVSITYGQNAFTDTSATCVAFWKKGETRRYFVTKTKEKFSGTERVKESEISFEVILRVIDSTDKGYTLEWKQRNYQSAGIDDASLSMINTVMRDLKLIYTTDELGTFKELVNWKEVRDFWLDNLNVAINRNDKKAMEILGKMKAMLEKRENVEVAVIREVQLYHAPYGLEYSLGGEATETALPNISGGSPIPAFITLRLNSLDVPGDVCSVRIDQAIDKRKGRDILIDLMRKLVPAAADADFEASIQELLMDDVQEYMYSISTGWISRIGMKRTIRIADLLQEEKLEIMEDSSR